MSVQWETLATALKASLTEFSNEDCYLVENDVNERSITHVLGCYLQRRIALHVSKVNRLTSDSLPRYKVDCEYNRFGPDERKWVPMHHEIDGGDELFYTPHPDIIVHDRGLWGHNLLVVEAKKRKRTDTLGRVVDKMKLAAYLFPPLRYEYGLFLCLGESQDDLLVEAKLVRQAAVEREHLEVINRVWGPLHQIVVESIDDEGKIKFRRTVRDDEDSKLRPLEEQLEERCGFLDVLDNWLQDSRSLDLLWRLGPPLCQGDYRRATSSKFSKLEAEEGMRDEFPKPVGETLAKRVGNRCSNPTCRKRTSGPHTEDDKALNVGVAAHITAASLGGPRYDPSLTPEERKGIGNGIWLCQSCAKLVDNDEARHTKALLVQWKQDAEQEALREVESTARASDLYFENTEVSGGKGSIGPGGDAWIKGAKGGGGVSFIGGSIRGGDGGEGGGKGGDAIVEGGAG